jgi:plastocyanin
MSVAQALRLSPTARLSDEKGAAMWNHTTTTLRRRRIGLLAAGVATAALAAAVVLSVGSGKAATGAATVQIANFAFAPRDLAVTAGTTVVWKNADDSPHRVADSNGAYASAALDTNDSFSHTFAKPGVYSYFCSIHPYMKGKIVVTSRVPKS